MSAKRKRQDESQQNGLRPWPVLLEALKGGDLVAVQSSIPQLQAHVAACRKAPESSPAKMLEKQLGQRKSMPELLTAFDFAFNANNKALISSLCRFARSLLALRIVNLAPFQHELGLEILDKASPALQKALQPGHNESNATALALLSILVKDVTEEKWTSKARQVWSIVSADAKNLVRLLGVRHSKTVRNSKNSDIRTLLLGIFVPLLSPQSPQQIREDLLSIKGLLSVALKGLVDDEPPVVYGFLHALFHGGLQGPRISMDQRCAVAEVAFQPLLQLTSSAFGEQKGEYARRWLLAAIASISAVQQPIKTISASNASSNPSSTRALTTLLSALRPGESQSHTELALSLVQHCPSLLNSFWQRLQPSLDPRLSSRWIATITLATRLVCLPPSAPIHHASFEVIMDSCLPLSFTQAWSSKGLAFENPLVSYLVALFLLASLQKSQTIIDNLTQRQPPTGRAENIVKRIRSSLTERLPDPKTVINLLQKSVAATEASEDDLLSVLTYLRLIKMYHELVPDTAAALRFDFTKLVDPLISNAAPALPLLASAQIVFLQLSVIPGVQISWLKSVGPNTPLHHLCRLMVLTPSPAIADAASETLFHILAQSNLFEPHQGAEIAVWICAIRGAMSGDEEMACLVGASSFQRTSSSVFRCIEETDAMEHDLNGRTISPLFSGFLHQLSYFAEHRKDDKSALGRFASRIVAGYTASHGMRTASCLRSLAAKQVDVPTQPETSVVSPPEVHNLWMDRAFYNLDVHLADVSLAKLQHGPSRGVPLLILQLRVKQLLQQSGPSALTIVNRVLSSSAGRFVVTAIADEADTLHRLEKQCLKSTSPEDVANFGFFIGLLSKALNAASADEPLRGQLLLYMKTLWGRVASTPFKRPSLLLQLLPSSTLQQRTTLLNDLASITDVSTLPQPSGLSLWSALLKSLDSWVDVAVLSSAVRSTLLQLSSRCNLPEASRALSHIIGGVLPAGFQAHRRSFESSTSDTVPAAVTLATAWLKSLLEAGRPWPAHDIRPALALSPTALSSLTNAFNRNSISKPLSPVVKSLLETIWKNEEELDEAGELSPLVTIVQHNLSESDVFEQDQQLAFGLTAFAARHGDPDHQAIQPALDWLASLPPSAVTACLVQNVALLSKSLALGSRAEVLTLLLEKVYLWLVRRFAEDESDTPTTLGIVVSLNRLIATGMVLPLYMKPHLVAPVMTAAFQNRLLSPEVMELCGKSLNLVASTSAVQWAQQVVAHQDIRRGLSGSSTARPHIIKVIMGLLQQLGKFDTPPELYTTLLSCYGGTLAEEDLLIKQALQKAELAGIWSLSQNLEGTSLRLRGMTEVASGARALAVLDPDMAYASCIELSSASTQQAHTQDSSSAYDPEFLLSLLAVFISAPGIDVQDFLALVRANILGVALCGTKSSSKKLAIASDRLLARLRLRLQGAAFAEKDEILLALHHGQTWSATESASSVSALFLAQCCRSIATPENNKYPIFLRYLLQRAEIDFSDTPLLYQTLYSTEQGKASEERRWLLEILRDGLCQPKDWLALRRRQTWDLLAGLFLSDAASSAERAIILQFLGRAVVHDVAVSDLTRRSGLLEFLRQASPHLLESDEEGVFDIILRTLDRLRPDKRTEGKVWLDALQTVQTLSRDRTANAGSVQRLRCYRRIVLVVNKLKTADAQPIDAEISCMLLDGLNDELAQADADSEVAVALLHDTTTRAMAFASRLNNSDPTLASRWSRVLQRASSLASLHSKEVRQIWLQKFKRPADK